MRSKISDQDLTDYALDELDSNARLYVESMLAVSEECRNDVYETIDTAMLLEEGFERANGSQALGLTPAQREALLDVRVPNHFVRRAVAVLAMAAAFAFALVTREQWMPKEPAAEVARVSSQMGSYVVQAVSAAEGEDFVNQLAAFRKLTEEPGKWLPSPPTGGSAAFDSSHSLKVETTPYSGLEFVP